ncbi:hypothetical protein ACA910_021446 [Epithemia clementina (nom. ined.)]
MVEEHLELGGSPDDGGGYFDDAPQEPHSNTNGNGAEDVGKMVNEAVDHIGTMEAKTELDPWAAKEGRQKRGGGQMKSASALWSKTTICSLEER